MFFIISTVRRTDQRQSNTKADPQWWPWVCYVSSRGLVGVCLLNIFLWFGLFRICSGSAMDLSGDSPWGHLNPLNSSVKLIHLFFLRPESPSRVHSKYMCRDIWLFFSSDMGLLFKSVSSLIVRYRLARHGRPEIDLYPDLDLRSVKLGQVGTVCTRLIFLQKIFRLQSSIHKFIVN